MQGEMAAKKGSVERLITDEIGVAAALAGRKRAVRRNSRYADPGERFVLSGQAFVVQRVYQQALGEMTDADARAEGFDSMEQYKGFILAMHQGMPWLPQMTVWVHEFEPVDDGERSATQTSA